MEVELIDLYEPNGWVHIPLRDRNDRMVKAFMLQVRNTGYTLEPNVFELPWFISNIFAAHFHF